jgi:hypothetical protein
MVIVAGGFAARTKAAFRELIARRLGGFALQDACDLNEVILPIEHAGDDAEIAAAAQENQRGISVEAVAGVRRPLNCLMISGRMTATSSVSTSRPASPAKNNTASPLAAKKSSRVFSLTRANPCLVVNREINGEDMGVP